MHFQRSLQTCSPIHLIFPFTKNLITTSKNYPFFGFFTITVVNDIVDNEKTFFLSGTAPKLHTCVPGISHAPCTDFGKRPKTQEFLHIEHILKQGLATKLNGQPRLRDSFLNSSLVKL